MIDDHLAAFDEKLTAASTNLGEAVKMIKLTTLDYSAAFRPIAEAIAKILEVQLAIYKLRPELTPEYLKPGWNASAPPDAIWKRED